MIMFFRKFSETWLAKVLLALIALSMAGLFGLGQMTSYWGTNTDAVRVGRYTIKPVELVRDMEKQARQMTTLTGQYVSLQDLLASGVLQSLITSKVNAVLSDIVADDLGLAASADAVGNYIVNNPNFQTMTGAYDPSLMRLYLNHMQMTEQELTASLRKQLAQQHLTAAIRDTLVVPSTMTDALYAYKNETRDFETILLPFTSVKITEKPSADTLKEYYEAMSDNLYFPEYRQIRLLRLMPEKIAELLPVSDEQLRAVYDARQDIYSTPEKRRVEQILVKDEQTAQTLFNELTADNFAKIALEKANQDQNAIDLGWIEKASVVEEVGEAAFGAIQNQVLPPVQSQFGYHILIVRDIEPAKQTPFTEVKDEIRASIRAEQAYDILVEKSKILDDALGEGKLLEEAAKLISVLPESVVSIDASGVDSATGKALDDLPAELVQKVFTLNAGESSPLYAYNGGYIVVELQSVTPSTRKSFEQAKDLVQAEWIQDMQKKKIDEFAQSILSEIKQSKDLNTVAKKHHLEMENLNDISREAVKGIPVQAVADLFNAKENDALLVPVDEHNYVVVKVKDIKPADFEDTVAIQLFDNELSQQLSDSLYQHVLDYYKHDYAVEINQALIQETFEPYMKNSD